MVSFPIKIQRCCIMFAHTSNERVIAQLEKLQKLFLLVNYF